MSAVFLAGKSGSLSIAGNTVKLKSWQLSMDGDVLDVTNFGSGVS